MPHAEVVGSYAGHAGPPKKHQSIEEKHSVKAPKPVRFHTSWHIHLWNQMRIGSNSNRKGQISHRWQPWFVKRGGSQSEQIAGPAKINSNIPMKIETKNKSTQCTTDLRNQLSVGHIEQLIAIHSQRLKWQQELEKDTKWRPTPCEAVLIVKDSIHSQPSQCHSNGSL